MWADCAEDVGGSGALVTRRDGTGAALGPPSRDLVLLANARFVGRDQLWQSLTSIFTAPGFSEAPTANPSVIPAQSVPIALGLSDLSGQPLGRRMALAPPYSWTLRGFPALLNLPDRVSGQRRKLSEDAGEYR